MYLIGIYQLLFQVFQYGMHHFTRSAPGSEKIYEHKGISLNDVFEFCYNFML